MNTRFVAPTLLIAALAGVAWADEPKCGFLPHPNPIVITNGAVSSTGSRPLLLSASGSSTLPTAYDLRTASTALSPVRNQSPYGTCWAFAALAPLEYQMRRDEDVDADLSENNLVNLHGFYPDFNTGGNDWLATAVFLREEGPVAEKLDPYPRPGKSVRERAVRIPRKVVFVPTGAANLKAAVYTYGPIETSMYYDDAYKNGSAYYYSGSSSANHAVSIVGWDDAYARTNFKTQPSSDGAFIVRNSWGASWGDGGYCYVSYEDTVFGAQGGKVWTNLKDGSDYGHLYQHDPYGYIGYIYSDCQTKVANVFTATCDETLKAFGFYALAQNVSYTAQIVVNPSITSSGISGTSTTTVKSGTCNDAGYEVIDFDTTVSVGAGTNFAIVVQFAAYTYIPLMYYLEGYIEKVVAEEGKSYIGEIIQQGRGPRKTTYESWSDMSADGEYFCCKVYAANKNTTSTSAGERCVPHAWLDAYAAASALGSDYLEKYFYGAYNALAEHVAANGRSVEASYAGGLDPDNATQTNLVATIVMGADGKPVVDIEPKNEALWVYETIGTSDLKNWHVKEETDRFFRVRVRAR